MNVEEEIRLIIEELKESKKRGELGVIDDNKEISDILEDTESKVLKTYPDNLYDYKQEELKFLNSIKERILVLFEGLNNFEKGDIEARVELNIKFLEFLLATIDKRSEDISR